MFLSSKSPWTHENQSAACGQSLWSHRLQLDYFQIFVTNSLRNLQFSNRRVIDISARTLQIARSKPIMLSISFVGSRKMRNLNRQYRNKDYGTDVLSFLYEGEGPRAGDLIISPENAAKNAQKLGHHLDREICFLIVHGVLHLCGFDHELKRDEIKMFRRQRLIMKTLGNENLIPRARQIARSAR